MNMDMTKQISHIHIKRGIKIPPCAINGNILDSPQGVKLIILLTITISFPLDSLSLVIPVSWESHSDELY